MINSGRLDRRNDRGAGGDRGRFGPRYRDEGRDFGVRDSGRYGSSGRFDNDGDYHNRGRGLYAGGTGGGFQRSPRGRGSFGGAAYPPDCPPYSGPQYNHYGSDRPPHLQYNRGGYRGEGASGDVGRGGYGSYGSAGYNYYQTGERRRYDHSGDSSGGPPPAKQPAFGEGQYRGFQGDGKLLL